MDISIFCIFSAVILAGFFAFMWWIEKGEREHMESLVKEYSGIINGQIDNVEFYVDISESLMRDNEELQDTIEELDDVITAFNEARSEREARIEKLEKENETLSKQLRNLFDVEPCKGLEGA